MSLIDRIARDPGLPHGKKIRGHTWEAALELYLNNYINLQNIINQFELTAEEQTELACFKNYFDTLPSAAAKIAYFHDITACVIALQLGYMSQATFKNILGLPA